MRQRECIAFTPGTVGNAGCGLPERGLTRGLLPVLDRSDEVIE